jgi:hypothetical protein
LASPKKTTCPKVATAAPRELDRELADAARGGVQEHDVAGAHAGHEVHQPPSGKGLDGDSSHGRERHRVGEVQELVDRHRRQLGVRAARTARVVGDAGAEEGGVDALADDVDHPGGLAARDPGELGRVEHGTAAVSEKFTPTAWMRTRTWPGAGVGSGTVARVSTSGGPKPVIWIARIRSA